MEFSGLHYCLFVKVLRCCFNQLWYFITVDFVCQQLFLIFLNSFRSSCRTFMPQRLFIITHCFQLVKRFFWIFSLFLSRERRRRDLNPRAAVNDLHPFQGCPFSLLGTSPCAVPTNTLFDCKPLLADSFHSHAPQDCLLKSNGEGGIRTHAPFRTNGFQDRLVMTTSIPLRVWRLASVVCASSAQDVF